MPKPLILITNDDGIYAPGLHALIEVVKELGDVIVIAPDKAQSGMGHAITINSTLRFTKVNIEGVEAYSSSGTPVDCVKLAVNKILKRKPDLCVSGINHGSNMSVNILYSGTMSAAIEGAMESIPSIGFSLCDYADHPDFTAAKKYVKAIAKNVLKHGLPDGTCLNVNIPKGTVSELKGARISRQAKANWIEELDERTDPSGKPYFWLTGTFKNFEEGNQETDVWAIQNNYVSVVPIQFDMTAHNLIPTLKNWNNEI
jgi:5'-nucleotidase